MYLIAKLEKLIFESPYWLLTPLLIALIFFKVGFWYIPNLDLSYQVSLNPFVNPFQDPNSHYLITTWLSPFLAWVFGINTWFKFFLLHLLFSACFLIVYAFVVSKKFQKDQARISLICLVILPVTGSIYYWIGPDALTVLLILLIFVLGNYSLPSFLLSMMLGLQHFEQGVLGAAALLLSALINSKFSEENNYRIRFYSLFFLGVVLGKLIQLKIFSSFGLEINSGRLFWLQHHYKNLISQFTFNFQFILWSTLGLGWLLVIHYIEAVKNYWGFLVGICTLLLLLPITQDQTRVLSIVLLPIFLNYCLFNFEFLRSISRTQCAAVFLLWLIIPWGWVFSGNVQVSVVAYMMMNLLNKFLGWFSVPAYHDYWPFH